MRRTKGVRALEAGQKKVLDRIRAQSPELADKLSNLNYEWFTIKNEASDAEADVYIYDEIVPEWMVAWFGGVSAEGMIAQLNEITAPKINVRINSPGGAVFEAIAIYNALVAHSADIHVYVDALAASAASVIAMAGDKVTMMVGSQLMIHDALGLERGNAAELRAYAEFLDKQSDNIASIYAHKTGGDPADMRALMLAETWMFAQEAVELGLADEVYSKPAQSDDPPSEDDPAPEEDPEEEPTPEGEEDPAPEGEEGTEDVVENRMSKVHSLSNRGFKHAGRRKAPSPQNAWDSAVNEILASLGSK